MAASLAALLLSAGLAATSFAGETQPPAPQPLLPQTENLFGDMGGLRPFLARYGITLNLAEFSEVLGNVTGGVKRGFDYEGLTTATLQLDTEKAFGWKGGRFTAAALQIHGQQITETNLHVLEPASNIEGDRSLRLWELWYQQALPGGAVDIKFGLQSLDQEFMLNPSSAVFLNGVFGWPTAAAVDMPGGGPVYPLTAPGIRLRFKPNDAITALAGVYDGAPAPFGPGEPQQHNASGANFPWNAGVLTIAELQFAYPAIAGAATPGKPARLPGTYRVGAWYDSARFDDLEFDTTGLSLANPASNGMPRQHRGDFGVYLAADQMVWKSADDANRTLNLFARVAATPLTDRNLVDFNVDGGLTLKAPLPHRDNDVAGIGFGLTHIGAGQRGLDRTFNTFGTFTPMQTSEGFVSFTYFYQAAPWLQLQPDFQYFFNPGAGLADPARPGHRVGDEAVLGLRTNISF